MANLWALRVLIATIVRCSTAFVATVIWVVVSNGGVPNRHILVERFLVVLPNYFSGFKTGSR